MGKLNEIQKQMTQSYGDNAFTTTIKDDTVEFDSLKDKFTFKDEIEVPSLKVNGEPVVPAEPQQQADWNQNDNTKADYIKNRICSSRVIGRSFSNTDSDVQYLDNGTAYFRIEDIDENYLTNILSNRYLTYSSEWDPEHKDTLWIGDWYTDDNVYYYASSHLWGEASIDVYLEDTEYGSKGLYISYIGEGVYFYIPALEEISYIDKKYIEPVQEQDVIYSGDAQPDKFLKSINTPINEKLVFNLSSLETAGDKCLSFKGVFKTEETSIDYAFKFADDGEDIDFSLVYANLEILEEYGTYLFDAYVIAGDEYHNDSLMSFELFINLTKVG